MLGMIIGVAAVIALMSIGRGAQEQITAQIQGMGTNLIFIRPGSTQEGGVRGGQGTAQSLTLDDAEALASSPLAPHVLAVAPEMGAGGQVVAQGRNWSTRFTGVTPAYADVRNTRVAAGEFFTQQQLDARAAVAVLGATVAQNLFMDSDPIGQTVRINSGMARAGVSFRVIGVLESKGGTGFGNQDDQVLVPLTTLQARLFMQRGRQGGLRVASINVQATGENDVRAAVEEIGEILRQRHRSAQDDFVVQTQEDFLQTFSQIAGTFTLLLGAIAGISLVVGGIGIMNIMLVSVTERTREIGIRKAVGARRQDILLQFLVESVVVSLAGGAAGVGLGAGVSRLISTISVPGAGGAAQALQTVVSADAVVLAFCVSAAVGLFFGIYPAMRASRLNPIDALRYE
ncbi:MAG: ABC transporter permease [Chloroflexi bacterium]|nr:ABC transporter permease [Chloroflexota bacterium]